MRGEGDSGFATSFSLFVPLPAPQFAGMLVTTEELARHLDDPRWVVFDCRHDLADHGRGARLYAEGHVPGAVFAAVETDLSGSKTGRNGRHPLPDPATFAAFLARSGVNSTSQIVGYDDAGGLYAARLWWLARWIGLEHVALLDGGLGRWAAGGGALTRELPRRAPGSVQPRANTGAVWTADDVQRRLHDPRSLVIDARAPERFRGDVEPMDPVAGHIPGAANRFYKANLNADLSFRPAEELRREFAALLGERNTADVAHQCGSGITACANLFAMEFAGLPGSRLYAGSWSEWVADPARPVARGAAG